MFPLILTLLPAAPPNVAPARVTAAKRNFGLVRDKLTGGERYLHKGKEISRQQVRRMLSATVPDDAGRLRLTVIGSEAQRRQVVDDLAKSPALAEWRGALAVQAYPPEHWAVAQAGFVTTGMPTIYLQAPDGVVLHRQDDYQGGAEALAVALRKADPNYRPERDRDRRLADLFPRLPRVPWSAAVLAAALVGILLFPRRKP